LSADGTFTQPYSMARRTCLGIDSGVRDFRLGLGAVEYGGLVHARYGWCRALYFILTKHISLSNEIKQGGND
jgi:hypothetical protein